ncbi:uncharacterized protein [Prorops nasuta]|uniref:uncharacterized protein n=1 Tax=Prorops nasuta TaxID=863751 RepID=UPI0034CD6C15
MKNIENMYMDGTFQAVANFKDNNIQLFTILVTMRRYPKQAIPCFWILMKNRRTVDYLEIFSFLKDNFIDLKPKLVMLDFERATANAVQIAYTDVQITHCYFHYSQALIKKAQNLSIINKTKNKSVYPERFIIIRKLTFLALLPSYYIRDVLKLLKKNTETQFGNFFGKYFKYYEKFWINEIKPENFSVFKRNNRTNNFSESYNSKLNSYLGKKPHINLLISYMKMLLKETKSEIDQAANNIYKKRETKKKNNKFERRNYYLLH